MTSGILSTVSSGSPYGDIPRSNSEELRNCFTTQLSVDSQEKAQPELKRKSDAVQEDKKQEPPTKKACFPVLLTEDNEMNVRMMVKMRKDGPYSCEIALDGQEALNMFKRKRYSLIVADQETPPKMNGDAFIKQVRQDPDELKKNTPVVVQSAGDPATLKTLYSDLNVSKIMGKLTSAKQFKELVEELKLTDEVLQRT